MASLYISILRPGAACCHGTAAVSSPVVYCDEAPGNLLNGPGATTTPASPGPGEKSMSEVLTGAEFKKQLRGGTPKMGLFVNSSSPTVVEQLAFSGYDWLLVDSQHGDM